MPEPVYHLHTGEVVAWAFTPAELEERDRRRFADKCRAPDCRSGPGGLRDKLPGPYPAPAAPGDGDLKAAK